MKRKALVILSILLVLYIVHPNLTGSSDIAARQNETNMIRDFLPSSFYNATEQVAYAGDDDWADSKTKNLVHWTIGGIRQERAYFNFSVVSDAQLIGFEYVCYNALFEPITTLEVYNGTGYDTLFTISYSSKWNNGTYFGGLPSGETIELRLNSKNTEAGAFVDYLALKFIYATWESVQEVEFLFVIPLDETLLNWLLIFLGLFMIPASTLYLVKGGKDDMSANKFFYFCIAFMIGWGLLLGGIM